MPTRGWTEEVLAALEALGGEADLDQICDYIEANSPRHLPDTWRATVQFILQRHTPGTKTHASRYGKDLFRRVNSRSWGIKGVQSREDPSAHE